MNKFKIAIFNSKKSFYHRIFADFGYVILTILSNERCWCGLSTFFSTLGQFFDYFYPSTKKVRLKLNLLKIITIKIVLKSILNNLFFYI